ncbi:MAG: hypothetical protein ACR2LX_14115, partial [Jatrophihabitans sp.]
LAAEESLSGHDAGLAWFVLLALLLTIALTAAYATRAWLLLATERAGGLAQAEAEEGQAESTQEAAPAGDEHATAAHRSRPVTVAAAVTVCVLAVLTVVGGLLLVPIGRGIHIGFGLAVVSVVLVVAVFFGVRALAAGGRDPAARLGPAIGDLSDRGFRVDAAYVGLGRVVTAVTRLVMRLDRHVVDAYPRGAASVTSLAGRAGERAHRGTPSAGLLAVVVGVVLVAVAGARTVQTDRRGTSRAWARFVPWEVALLAASVACYLAIRREGAIRIVRATVQVNPLVTAYPLIALSGAVLLIGRGAGVGLPALRRMRLRSGAGYLAARRISRSPAVAVGVLVGVALPVAVFVYSVALSGSTQRDVAAKYRANVGAPQAFGLLTHGFTPRAGELGTVVGLIDNGARTDSGRDVAIEGVDPATFARYAYGGAALRPTLRTVQGRGVPVVIVNASPATPIHSLRIGDMSLDVRVADSRSTFPGLRDPYRPLIVLDRRHLPVASPLIDRTDELWTTTAHATSALDLLGHEGVEANYAISPTTFLDSSGLRPVTWVFGYLRAIALLTGGIGVAGLGFAFAARTRRRARAYHLARRMGMSRATHRRSVVVELGTLVGSSWLVGAGLAVGAVASVYRRADPYPAFPPPPRFPPVVAPMVSTGIGAVAATLVGSWLLHRMIDRSDPSTVLRS